MKKVILSTLAVSQVVTGLAYAAPLNTLARAVASTSAQQSVSQAQLEKTDQIHQTDLLALRVLVQLDYLNRANVVDLQNVNGDLIKANSARGALGIAATLLSATAGAVGLLGLTSTTLSFQKPGQHIGTTSNPSSIIGEGGVTTYKYTVTPLQAYGPIAGFAALTVVGLGTYSFGFSQFNKPISSEFGRKIMGFDTILNGMVSRSVSDLSTILNFTPAQKQALEDAVKEDLIQQLGSGKVDAKNEVTIDVLKTATSLKMIPKDQLESLKAVSELLFSKTSSQDLTALSKESLRTRLTTMKTLNSILEQVRVQNPKASETLKPLAVRTKLAINLLTRLSM